MGIEISPKILLESRKALFKRRDFDFITVREGKKHEKQNKALCILTDNETEEFGYGGAAGGAKSWTGCVWLAFMCECYPGTRWFIGREELKRLRESTLITFFKVCRFYGIEGWKYNGQDHYIQFANESRIDLLDLKYLPSDHLYERYGSTEYTGGWIEEGGEVNFGAYDTLRSRIGRQLNDFYGIMGKLFVTLNPKKNWCHSVFWKPFKAGVQGVVKFLQALVTDNPYIDSGYKQKLDAIKDKVRKQRLLHGNFDYDDDDDALMDYDAITDIFTNEFVEDGEGYITADIARFGKDKSIIGRWRGFRLIEIFVLEKKRVTEVAAFIKAVAGKHRIGMSNVIADEDGVGGGVVDILECKGFVNGSSPLVNPEASYETYNSKTHEPPKENYKNLRSQCYYRFSDRTNKRGVYVLCEDEDRKEAIVEELEQIKKKNPDSDETKLQVVSREDIIAMLGRSPDYASMLMMREWFELNPEKTFWALGLNGEMIKI
jgi:phage terminase large subunit